MANRLYLDNWIKEKIGLGPEEVLTQEKISDYQLRQVKETLTYVKDNSGYYAETLSNISPDEIRSFDDFCSLPFTLPSDLVEHGLKMLCAHPSAISRIVTMETSGTTGQPKKVYFTEEDQRLTIDYFHHGMQYLCKTGDRVLILLPCKLPGSVGNLLEIGLDRMDVEAVCYGPLKCDADIKNVMKLVENQHINCIVGTPTEIAQLAVKTVKLRCNELFRDCLRTVLLTAEYVSLANCEIISEAWDCRVYEHYGMTEMGLGCAVLCTANGGRGMSYPGYHIREADLYIELVNPHTGDPVENGEFGEIVFTTLTRKGMPLIRYRTGDISRWLLEPCPCGSVLRRMDKVRNVRYIASIK